MKRNEVSDKDLIPNTENQRLMRNAGIPKILLQILKISLSKNQKENEDYQDLIRSIYLFLIRFCTDNLDNQNLLGVNMDFLLQRLEDCSLVIFLIKEIFKNNKGFIAAKRQAVVRNIMQKEAKLSDESVQKQHYLMILKTLSKNYNRNSKKSSTEILNIISPVDESTINCFIESQEEIQRAQKLVDDFKSSVTNYSETIKNNKDNMNEIPKTKAQILLGYFKIVMEFLQKVDFFLPFKKSIVEYFYHTLKS